MRGGGFAHFCIKTEVKRHYIKFEGFILKFIKRNVGKKINFFSTKYVQKYGDLKDVNYKNVNAFKYGLQSLV